MPVLVLYCNPVETSFHASLHAQVVKNLKATGPTVDACDLYAEGSTRHCRERSASATPRLTRLLDRVVQAMARFA